MPANSRAHKGEKRKPGKSPMKRATPAEKDNDAPAKQPERKRKLRSR